MQKFPLRWTFWLRLHFPELIAVVRSFPMDNKQSKMYIIKKITVYIINISLNVIESTATSTSPKRISVRHLFQ